MTDPADLSLYRLPGLPLVATGDDLAAIIAAGVDDAGLQMLPGDIVVLAQKIVSKAEGRIVDLGTVKPSAEARQLAAETDKDPRAVELILRESTAVIRKRPGVLIVEHRLGIILANAGIDRSNVAGDEDIVLLLPEDPDASARKLRAGLEALTGVAPGVIISDSVGRPWRLGTTGVAIGCAAVPVIEDLRGTEDLFGRPMQVAETAPADALATAAGLLIGEGAEATPAVLIRGLSPSTSRQPAAAVLRPVDEDLFR